MYIQVSIQAKEEDLYYRVQVECFKSRYDEFENDCTRKRSECILNFRMSYIICMQMKNRGYNNIYNHKNLMERDKNTNFNSD